MHKFAVEITSVSDEIVSTIIGAMTFAQKVVMPEIVPVLSLERAIVSENAPGEHHCARIRACGLAGGSRTVG